MRRILTKPIFIIAGVFVFSVGIWGFRLSFSPDILASGEFHRVAHKGKGRAEIIKRSDGEKFLVLRNFRTARSKELYVYLISASDALENETVKNSKIYSLGKLKNAETERDEYRLPRDLDVAAYGAVTIWNKKYESNFTTAPLK